MKESLDAGLKITTGGSHEIGSSRNHVWSTGPWSPYQSICSGRIDCAVNQTERSSTTLDSVCNGLELEGIKFESKDAIGFVDGEYPIMKGDALLRMLLDLAVE